MNASICLLEKSEVIERLGISERTLENMINARKFPRGLKLDKRVIWDETVVESWLRQALAYQVAWEPPAKGRKTPKTQHQ